MPMFYVLLTLALGSGSLFDIRIRTEGGEAANVTCKLQIALRTKLAVNANLHACTILLVSIVYHSIDCRCCWHQQHRPIRHTALAVVEEKQAVETPDGDRQRRAGHQTTVHYCLNVGVGHRSSQSTVRSEHQGEQKSMCKISPPTSCHCGNTNQTSRRRTLNSETNER